MLRALIRWIFLGIGTTFLILGLWSYSRPVPANASAEIRQALEGEYDPYLIQIVEPSTPTNTNLPDTYQDAMSPRLIDQSLDSTPNIPETLIVPAIQLRAPIQVTASRKIIVNSTVYEQWLVPDTFAVGWNPSSGAPGSTGNVVLYGHHNVNGAVFSRLYQVQHGDELIVVSRGLEFHYKVTDIVKVKEKDVSFAQMLQNAKLLEDTGEERLTLITCWPPYDSTYRLIVIATNIP